MTSTEARTLAGRRIVITRAPEQAEDLVRRLTELGADVILLPMVRFLDPVDTVLLDQSIAALEEFDWLVFTSANAVRFFLGRCRALGRRLSATRLSIAVVGPATRLALEAEHLHAALVPREFSGAALAAEFAQELAGKRVLLPRSDRASDELPVALRKIGSYVTEVIAYRTAEPESLDVAAFRALRLGEQNKDGAALATFFSPSSFHNFVRALGDDALREMSMHLAFAAVGPVTAEAIRGAGLPVTVEAPAATTESLIAALERHCASGSVEKDR